MINKLLLLAFCCFILVGCGTPAVKIDQLGPTPLTEKEGIVIGAMLVERTKINSDGTITPESLATVHGEVLLFVVPKGTNDYGFVIPFENKGHELQSFRTASDKYYLRNFASRQFLVGPGEFSTVKGNFDAPPGKITYIGTLKLKIVTHNEKGFTNRETIATLEAINDIETARAEIERKFPEMKNDIVVQLPELTKASAPIYPMVPFYQLREMNELLRTK